MYVDSGVALIRSQNVYNNVFAREGLAYLTDDHAAELANVEAHAGDVLLNITGDSVARCTQVPVSVLPARVNQHVAIIRPKPDQLDARFLRYFLTSPAMQSHMLMLAGAGATRNALTKGMIEEFHLPAIALVDQQNIAEILGALDDKIELNRRMNETLEAITRAVFKSWFLDHESSEKKGTWTTKSWGDLISLEYGKSLQNYDEKDAPYAVFGTNGVIGRTARPLCRHEGIIIGRKGAYRGVHFSDAPFFAIDTAFYVEPKVPLEMRWAYYEMLRLDINGMDSGSAIPSTSRTDFYALPVLEPPIHLQRRFVNRLSPAWERQRANEAENATLAQLRDTLLPKLLSGEIRVGAAEKRVAEVV